MNELELFSKIVAYLIHPLVLVGFVVLLFFGVLKLLIIYQIIPQVYKTDAPTIVKILMKYGFIIALITIIVGFGFKAFEIYMNGHPNVEEAIRLINFQATPGTVIIGDKLKLIYTIENTSNITIDKGWLGATLKKSNGQMYYNITEDKTIKIIPGRKTYERYLTVEKNVNPDTYQLAVQVYSGLISDPKNSKLLDQSDITIEVKKKK